MEGFAERRDHKRALTKQRNAGSALVRRTVEHHVFIHLIGNEPNVVRCDDFSERVPLCARPGSPARVVRRIHEYGARFRRNRRRDRVEIGLEGALFETHRHRNAARELNVRDIAVVTRLKHDGLVARPHHRQNRRENALRCAGGDRNFRCGVIAHTVQRIHLLRDTFPQERDTRHQRILVMPSLHCGGDSVHQAWITIKIRKTLPKIDRLMFHSQRRHHRKHRGANFWEFGLKEWSGHIEIEKTATNSHI